MTPYEQGFTAKCAEFGITPRALRKLASVNPVLGVLGGSGKRFLQLLGGGSKALRRRYHVLDKGLTAEGLRLFDLETRKALTPDTVFSSVTPVVRKHLGSTVLCEAELAARDPSNARLFKDQGYTVTNGIGKYLDALMAAGRENDAAMRSELLKVIVARLGTVAGVGGAGYGVAKAVSGKKNK